MIIDMTNVEINEYNYIQDEGDYLLKVTKVTEDKTRNYNDVIKVFMEDRNGDIFIDDFVITDNAMWKLKLLTKALKMPNVVDTSLMVGRYVEAKLGKEPYDKNGETKYKLVAKKYRESKLTNTLEESQQQNGYNNQSFQQDQHNQSKSNGYQPEVSIDDDSIPF